MLNRIPPVRQSARFKSWVVLHGLKFTDVAEWLQVSDSRASQIIESGMATPPQVQTLREIGVPEESLPAASRGKPGPVPGELAQRRKAEAQSQAA